MKYPNDPNNTMQQEPKCEHCECTMVVGFREVYIPVYDDGGSVDCFDVDFERVEVCTNPSCNDALSDIDDLPF